MTPTCARPATGLAVMLVALLVAAGCAMTGEPVAVTTIDADEAAQLLQDRDEVVVIDVRTPEEYAAGHLTGAHLLDLSGGVFADTIGSYDREGTYVLYCRTGSRSAEAASMMEELGFTDVRDAGGYDELAATGVPTEG